MIKSSKFSWFVVSDINKAEDFYFNKLGLILKQKMPEFNWLEVAPIDNSYLIGISAYNKNTGDHFMPKPGSGFIMTFDVENIEEAVKIYKEKNIKFLGDIQEIPGHVKMILAEDEDGNKFQICQHLN